MRAIVLSILALVALGCGARPSRAPTHAAVVCAERGCTASERTSAFDEWARSAMHRKGSTFALWEVASSVLPRLAFAACVPDHWGPQVVRAKAAFLRDARERAASGGDPLPAGCSPEGAAESPVLLIDDGHRRQLRPSPTPLQLAVVCDRSDSMLGVACDEAHLRGALDDWLIRSGGAPGSSLVLVGVGGSRDTAEILLRLVVPDVSAGERVAQVLAARSRLRFAFEHAPTNSAIAEAISVAGEELERRPGNHRLLVLSDLRQVTPGAWNFEEAAPPPQAFVHWLGDRQLLAHLAATSVEVCGFHHMRAPGARRFDARLADAVQGAWGAAFNRMGATAVDLRGDCAQTLWADRSTAGGVR